MTCKVFILGRPGSGKSAAVRYLHAFAQKRGQSVVQLNDYDILYRMFLDDTEQRRFRPTDQGGFDVLDPEVRVEAQIELEQEARRQLHLLKGNFLVIELGRPNYKESFELFSEEFLRDAHFLFIAADYKICLERVHERSSKYGTKDDYFLADHILTGRYSCPYVPPSIAGKKISIIENIGPLEVLHARLGDFVSPLLKEDRLSADSYDRSSTASYSTFVSLSRSHC